MSKNSGDHSRTQHNDVKCHFVREKASSGEIAVAYVPTDHQLADLVTKPLDNTKIQYLRQRVLGH